MKSSLVKRMVTAVILAPIFIWSIFNIPKEYFSYFLLLFVALGCWEFSRLINIHNLILRATYSLFVVALSVYLSDLTLAFSLVLYLSVVWWLVNLFWVISYPQKTKLWFDPLPARIVSGIMLLVPMWLSLSYLHLNYGPAWFLLLILIVWAADSGAYFVGRSLGRNKLSPFVSPKKTIEGVIGGATFSILMMVGFFALYINDQDPMYENYLGYLILTLVVACASVLGDLYESLFKRVSGIKDSGQILPGHGGILDRIDSLTAAAPFFVLGLELL